jgi:hypothetical protein
MKAEINEKGILELQSETKKESEKVYKWMQENKGRIIIPEGQYELAVCRFSLLDIAIFIEPYKEENIPNRFYEGAKQYESKIPGV